MSLYNMKSRDGTFEITKFDSDLNPLDTYQVSSEACTCPAGVRPSCRHRQMLPAFIAADAIDQPMFWHFEEQAWYRLDEPATSELKIADNETQPSDPIVPQAVVLHSEPAQPDLPFNLALRDLTDTNTLLAAAELEINRSEPARNATAGPSLGTPTPFSQPSFKPRRI